MQDRYAGDIGDFGKFGLLRAICREGFRVGINWYYAEPMARESMNRDGEIDIPETYSVCDPGLYEALCRVRHSERIRRAFERMAFGAWEIRACADCSLCHIHLFHPEKMRMSVSYAFFLFCRTCDQIQAFIVTYTVDIQPFPPEHASSSAGSGPLARPVGRIELMVFIRSRSKGKVTVSRPCRRSSSRAFFQ